MKLPGAFLGAACLLALGACEEGSQEVFPEPVPDDCITNVSAGTRTHFCSGNTFDLMVPPACLERACGLIVDVHGFSMSGKMEDNNTNLRALGLENEYFVLQPNAPGTPPLSSFTPGVDDSKLYDFVLRVMAAFHVDEDRVHITGLSQGGFMTWRFICNHADLLASAAPVGATRAHHQGEDICLAPNPLLDWREVDQLSCMFEPGEMPARELDILFMHGARDKLVWVECARIQRDAIIEAWDMQLDRVISEDSGHTRTAYTNANGTVFEYLEHEYIAENEFLGGHCYPGSTDFDPPQEEGQPMGFACVDESAFIWGEVVMEFFKNHPKR